MKVCVVCKDPKEIEAFGLNKRKKDGRQPYCRECQKPRQRAWYDKNKARHADNVASRNKALKREHVARVYEYLTAHPCVDCGEADPLVLDFDHVRGQKKSDINSMVWKALSWKTISTEIAKCEVRCANCHRRKTAKERNTWRYKFGRGEALR